MTAQTMGEQASALTCLAGLVVSHPDLPAAYITINRFSPKDLSVQLDSPGKVEAWREALRVPADKVFSDRIGCKLSLEFRAAAFGIMFHVYATYIPADPAPVAESV